MSDFDTSWKEALEHYFALFLAFFYPEIWGDIDWAEDWVGLDQELHPLTVEAEVGRKFIDKLVRLRTRSEDDVYLHVEVQCKPEQFFEHRLYTYNYRGQDRCNNEIVTVAVLGDDDVSWRPTTYHYEKYGCRKTFTFPIVKLLDWAGKEQELEANPNPFALLVLAHLKALETRQDEERRQEWKERVLKGLYDRELTDDDMNRWVCCIDWVMYLPKERNRQVWTHLNLYEKERGMRGMPKLSSLEEIVMEDTFLRHVRTILEWKFKEEGTALLIDFQVPPDEPTRSSIIGSLAIATTLEQAREALAWGK
jgi:hypothetical protein